MQRKTEQFDLHAVFKWLSQFTLSPACDISALQAAFVLPMCVQPCLCLHRTNIPIVFNAWIMVPAPICMHRFIHLHVFIFTLLPFFCFFSLLFFFPWLSERQNQPRLLSCVSASWCWGGFHDNYSLVHTELPECILRVFICLTFPCKALSPPSLCYSHYKPTRCIKRSQRLLFVYTDHNNSMQYHLLFYGHYLPVAV